MTSTLDSTTTAGSNWPFPVISADSHITEAPDTYLKYIDPAWRDRAPHIERRRRGDRRHLRHRGDAQADLDGPRRRGRQAAGGDPRQGQPLRRRCTAAAGTRRPAWPTRTATACRRGHLPDRRHGPVQPQGRRLQAGLLPGVQPLDRRLLRRPPRPPARAAARRRCARRRRASPTCTRSRRSGCAAS